MAGRTAIVFGGTGLVGRSVIDELIKNENYGLIRVLTRSKVNYPGQLKIMNFIVDFGHPESFSEQIRGDDLFICLGTTIRKAGSVRKMEEIDRDLPVTLAKSAKSNNVKRIAVVRPSLLLGERKEKRFGESAGKVFMKIFGTLLFGKFRKYRAIEAGHVACAMIRILQEETGKKIFESDHLQKIAGHK